MTRAYYNEHDPYAAQWLRNLIAAGEIAPGDVDERSIEDVISLSRVLPVYSAYDPIVHDMLGTAPTPSLAILSSESRHEPFHSVRSSPTNGFWRDADWLFCRDGKWRPVEPGTFPLAPGLPRRMGSILRGLVDLGAARRNRVGRLRGYGNAINIDVATNFIRSVM